MKEGYVIKSSSNKVSKEEEMSLINQYTRRTLKEDEVYIFSVVLCDNDIDRDFERFTTDALYELSKLYVGKTGILDHEAKSKNQMARIFSCDVEKIDGKVNKVGEPYYRLVARAYIPNSDKNKDLILELDSGIKKEVSVGCSVSSMVCSICGADIKTAGCSHRKGKKYGQGAKAKLCHVVLDQPTDAYEWSFVAIPAQKEAGVIKEFKNHRDGGVTNMQDIIKQFKTGSEVSISCEQSEKIGDYITNLEKQAEDGKLYREELKSEVIRLGAIVQADVNIDVMKNVTEKMSLDELKIFKKAFEKRAQGIITPKPQLSPVKQDNLKVMHTEFKI